MNREARMLAREREGRMFLRGRIAELEATLTKVSRLWALWRQAVWANDHNLGTFDEETEAWQNVADYVEGLEQ
jgi:hypothetical protein